MMTEKGVQVSGLRMGNQRPLANDFGLNICEPVNSGLRIETTVFKNFNLNSIPDSTRFKSEKTMDWYHGQSLRTGEQKGIRQHRI